MVLTTMPRNTVVSRTTIALYFIIYAVGKSFTSEIRDFDKQPLVLISKAELLLMGYSAGERLPYGMHQNKLHDVCMNATRKSLRSAYISKRTRPHAPLDVNVSMVSPRLFSAATGVFFMDAAENKYGSITIDIYNTSMKSLDEVCAMLRKNNYSVNCANVCAKTNLVRLTVGWTPSGARRAKYNMSLTIGHTSDKQMVCLARFA